MESDLLNLVTVVVVEPKHAGNIGSICRACKNMGVTNIVLVNPKVDYLSDETFKLGWASSDIIRNIQTVATLAEALADKHLAIATTMRRREKQPPLVSARNVIPQAIQVAASGQKVAFVFGREDNGLSDDELNQCHVWSIIPTNGKRPAINLSQAVMIYMYELFQASSQHHDVYQWNLATRQEIEVMYQELGTTINTLPITTRKGTEEFVALFRRVFNRTPLEERDVRLMIKLFKLIQKKERLS